MAKFFLLFALVLAPAWLHSAPPAPAKTAEAAALQDRLDRGEREIAGMTAYSARLERILERAGVAKDDDVEKLSVEQKMDRILPVMHCNNRRLIDAIAALARAARVPISVDWKSLTEAGIDQDAPVACDARNESARSMLREILSAAGGLEKCAVFIDDPRVIVTTWDEANKHVVTRKYDVTSVLPRTPNRQSMLDARELLGRIITDTVAPDSWQDAGGTVGSINITGNQMTITQTPANLQAIESLLEELDDNKRIAHRRALIDKQEIQIVALSAEIDRRVARCRSVGIKVPPRLDQAMNLTLPDAQFVGTPLAMCFDAVREASEQEIYVHWNVLNEAGIDGRLPITLSLHRQTLAAAMQSLVESASGTRAAIRYAVEENTITVSTQADFDKVVITCVYDIRDVPTAEHTRPEAVEALEKAIMTCIEPDSWRDAGGVTGSIRDLQGMLVITQTERAHARIKAYLNFLRSGRFTR